MMGRPRPSQGELFRSPQTGPGRCPARMPVEGPPREGVSVQGTVEETKPARHSKRVEPGQPVGECVSSLR